MNGLLVLNIVLAMVISWLSVELYLGSPFESKYYKLCCATVFALLLMVLVKKVMAI